MNNNFMSFIYKFQRQIFLKILMVILYIFCSNSALALYSANDNWDGEPFSGFKKYKVKSGSKYMISTTEELASEAGAWIMENGGNAIDAVIAAQLVLNVVEPHSSGIGGGGFLLYYDAKNKETLYFNGRENAPNKAFAEMFLDKNNEPRNFHDAVRGGLSVGVPGLLKILKASHEKYGKLPWKTLFKPAISIAKNGFIVNERMNLLIEKISYLEDFSESKEIYLDKNHKPLKAGDKIKNLKLANTLEIIANEGIKPFYQGEIAQDIVKAVQNSKINPGYLELSDLKNYQIKKGDLICSKYRQYKVCSMPLPSSGGVTILQILGILENFDLKKYKANSADFIHLFAEASKLAYADRNEYLADVQEVPIDGLIDKNYLKKRAKLIKKDKILQNVKPGNFKNLQNLAQRNLVADDSKELPSTTHLSVIDKDGNSVALTSSIEYYFGSGLSVRGFMLNNQLTDFSFVPVKNNKKVANRVEPNKQPRSSMSPALIFDQDDNIKMIVGSPGGPRIIQFVAKTIINHLDFNMDIQQAISSPNFVELNNVLELEESTKIAKLKPQLEKLGHKIKILPITSGINAVSIKDKIYGGADPRREGFVSGK